MLNKVESPHSSSSETQTLSTSIPETATTEKPHQKPEGDAQHPADILGYQPMDEYTANVDELLPLETFFNDTEGLDWVCGRGRASSRSIPLGSELTNTAELNRQVSPVRPHGNIYSRSDISRYGILVLLNCPISPPW
jgi:hypothetical protein